MQNRVFTAINRMNLFVHKPGLFSGPIMSTFLFPFTEVQDYPHTSVTAKTAEGHAMRVFFYLHCIGNLAFLSRLDVNPGPNPQAFVSEMVRIIDF